MAQLCRLMGLKPVASTTLMTRFIIWAMRADLR